MTRPACFTLLSLLLAACTREVPQPVDTTKAPAVGDTTSTKIPTRDSVQLAPPPTKPDSGATYTLTEHGLGPVQAGMTFAEAARATEGNLTVKKSRDPNECTYLTWRNGPGGVRVMGEGGRVVRVSVDSANIATDLGARVGDTEDRIKSLYGARVKVTPHKYTDGHYLTVTPSDTSLRIVFETDKGRVTTFRGGKRPQVEYIEGCA